MAKINLKYEHGAKYRANKCIRSNASYNPVRAKRYLRAPQLSVNNKCGEHNNTQLNAISKEIIMNPIPTCIEHTISEEIIINLVNM